MKQMSESAILDLADLRDTCKYTAAKSVCVTAYVVIKLHT